MRHPSGHIFETDLTSGHLKEYDTTQCGHCGRHTPMWKHQQGTGYFCTSCMKSICPQCAAMGDCNPLEKQLERAFASAQLYQTVKEF